MCRGVRKKRAWPCLLSSHRTRVLLIGVEGFPHGGFRHFIRYINIRGITPEEPGEEKQGESRKKTEVGVSQGLGRGLGVLAFTGCTRKQNTKQDKRADQTGTYRQETEDIITPMQFNVCLDYNSDTFVYFLDMSKCCFVTLPERLGHLNKLRAIAVMSHQSFPA